ncbi:MAG: polysaccharide biosynthesis C-terminal domain-containing protein, partial [Gammaproteobacteria bacterium]
SSYAAWALMGARAQGLFRFKQYAASSGLFVSVALLALAAPRAGSDVVAAMAGFAAANLAAATWCAIDLPKASRTNAARNLTSAEVKIIGPYATNAWLTSIVGSFVWARGELAVVKGHLGESAVGFYSVGLTLSGIINQATALLTGGLWPQIARGWDKGDRESVLRLSSFTTNLLMVVSGLSSGFVICFAPYIVALLFGQRFHESSRLVVILALGPLALASGSANLVLQAATNGRFARDVTLAGGVTLFGAALLLLPHFGIAGAAVARSATQIVVAGSTLVWLGRVTGHDARTRQNLRSFVLLVASAVGLVSAIALEPTIQFAGRLTLFTAYGCLVCVICSPIRDAVTLRRLRGVVGSTLG